MRTIVDRKNFRLTKNIDNPYYDGRCKNQVRAIKTFQQGQIIHSTRYRYENEIDGKMLIHEENEYRFREDLHSSPIYFGSDYPKLCDLLDQEYAAVDNVVEPNNLTEAATLARTSMDSLLIRAVEQLVAENKISPKEVLEAYNRNNNE